MSKTILEAIRENHWFKKTFETATFLLSVNTVTANLADFDVTKQLQDKFAAAAPMPDSSKQENGPHQATKPKKFTTEQLRITKQVFANTPEGDRGNPDHRWSNDTYIGLASPSYIAAVTRTDLDSGHRR